MGMRVTEFWKMMHFPTPCIATDFDTGHDIMPNEAAIRVQEQQCRMSHYLNEYGIGITSNGHGFLLRVILNSESLGRWKC